MKAMTDRYERIRAQRNVPPTTLHIVIDEYGEAVFASRDREGAHEHITDALHMETPGAEEWVVREYVLKGAGHD